MHWLNLRTGLEVGSAETRIVGRQVPARLPQAVCVHVRTYAYPGYGTPNKVSAADASGWRNANNQSPRRENNSTIDESNRR